jgi:hypothetical protein
MAITDIFARRYARLELWPAFRSEDAPLLVQCYRVVAEQLMPPERLWNGKENPERIARWTDLHSRLGMELGREYLSASHYQASLMNQPSSWWPYSMELICKNFMQAGLEGNPDRFMKERLSLVELAFRFHEQELAKRAGELPAKIAQANRERLRLKHHFPDAARVDQGAAVTAALADANRAFADSVVELNERLRQAGLPLNYHNGFIQIGDDEALMKEIERPFWPLIADPKWQNVDTDMKEALDRRDSGDRDAALYASKALESTIKIISGEKGLTHGGEKGAHNFIDNLGSAKSGQFISPWERDALKHFFTSVRNPLGHGPGGEPMPELTAQQTDWAIQTSMSWIKSLIQRI